MRPDARAFSPAADRNKDPILQVLQRLLPAQACVLEIAAGTGQHAAHFAAHMPGWTWLPTDGDAAALASIAAWCAGLPNVRPPQRLDLLAARPAPASPSSPPSGKTDDVSAHWHGIPREIDAIWCANLLHIAPWATCDALMQGAARHLAPGGLLITYGPYCVDGEPVAPSNLAFDADLRRRDPAWGLRRLADVADSAARAGLRLVERIAMPANNLVLVFR
ncbi:MAG TPA: DUF938 domain-containing protein [Quisquiliibacterium sp.]|nr:DUF938 domain-containing protein [Quisquiliibacterium sp.]